MADSNYLPTLTQQLDQTKPGIATSEFKGMVWLAGVIPLLTMILISSGMSHDQATNMAMAAINGINAIISFGVYVYSRIKVKGNQTDMLKQLLIEHIKATKEEK
jgi:hypothetical protein